tara:strand:- start:1492 stop:1896 length:405 start_codon:yes stop_codon:yes gene_type:complete
MKLVDKIFKTADKHPLLTFAAGSLGIMYLFETYGSINGLGQATFKTSGTDTDDMFRKTGHTGTPAPGTGRWDTVMPSPQGPQVRYDADYHAQPLMMDPMLEQTLMERGKRPVVQSASIRHGYEPLIFAGIRHSL